MSRNPSGPSEIARILFTSTSVGTSAYVTLIASTLNETLAISFQETSGQSFKLAIGPAGSEVDTLIIPSSSYAIWPLHIGKGTRLSLKAYNSTASTGEITATLYV